MIWHHCRRFGVSACEYRAYAIRGRLFNFAQHGYSAGQRLCARSSQGFSYMRLLELESSRDAVSCIEQTAPVSLRQPHLSWLKGNQV
jgi:hypothetical protein